MVSDELIQIPFFVGVSEDQLALLSPLFSSCEFVSGTLLFEQGDVAEYLYLVVKGEVTLRYKPEDGPEIIVSHIKTGGLVGWSAALGNRHYTLGAICGRQSQLLRVRGKDLRALCTEHPETGSILLDHLATAIAERLSSTHAEVINLLKQGIALNQKISTPALHPDRI